MSEKKRINLALQGGGSHGAFTWGALDAILEDERLEIVGVSGASAGAMNAVVMAAGLMKDRGEAREKLALFWRSIASDDLDNPLVNAWIAMWKAAFAPPAVVAALSDASSPYLLNPFDINPLRDVLAEIVVFEKLSAAKDGPKLFIAATNVRTGKGVTFHRHVLTPEHVMASATLPHLFQATVIKGEAYWDGGYSGNPPLRPLFKETDCQDTILVQINPIERREIPRTADQINNRINEISFNASLLAELKLARILKKFVEKGELSAERYPIQRMHRIGGDGRLEMFGGDTKFDTSWSFLQELRELGRASAKAWLAANYDAIGVRETLDVERALARTDAG